MDRFIGKFNTSFLFKTNDLKSNMDRFIGTLFLYSKNNMQNLKSNMDRFIGVVLLLKNFAFTAFKIQYG